MDYQLLKINNVTKVCDDRIIMNNVRTVLDVQWFDFQLIHLCNLLGIPVTNPMEYPKLYHPDNPKPDNVNYTDLFTRNQIFRKLRDKYSSIKVGNSEVITVPDGDVSAHLESLNEYGFSNTYKYKLFKPVLNKSNECVIEPRSYTNSDIKTELFYTEDEEEYNKLIESSSLESEEYQYNMDDKGDEELEDTPEEPIQPAKIDVGRVGKKKRKKLVNRCLKYGKLTWTRNSCYADSPIYLLFLRMMQSPDSQLSRRLLNHNIEVSGRTTDKKCSNREIRADGTLKYSVKEDDDNKAHLKNISDKFKQIYEDFRKGNHRNIEELRNLLGKCDGVLTSQWNTDGTQDADEFLEDLLRILQVTVPEAVVGSGSQSKTNKNTFYHLSQNNTNMDEINRNRRKYKNNYNFYNTADGSPVFSDTKTILQEKPVDIQILKLTPDDLIDKFRFDRGIFDMALDNATAESLESNKKYTNPLLNETFRKEDQMKINEHLENYTVPIQNILKTTSFTDTIMSTDEGIVSYHIIDNDYLLETNNSYYYHKDRPDEHLNIETIPEHIGFRQVLKIETSELDNQTDDIFIFIPYKTYTGMPINIRVTDLENITISGTNYKLNGLVYWKGNHYQTIFSCEGKYYNYNDLPAQRGSIEDIGNYANMITWNNSIAQKNATIYHYVKNS